jgi:hypothetical protein
MWGLRRLVFLFWRPAETYALYSQRFNPPPAQPWTFQRPGFAMMLRFIFWAFLSSASLPFSSQSPLQGQEGPQRAAQIERRQWTSIRVPILAMTSVASSYPWNQIRQKEQKTSYQPLVPIAMTSIIAYSGDPYQKKAQPQKTSHLPPVPVIAMTSVVTYPWHEREGEQKLGYQPILAMK